MTEMTPREFRIHAAERELIDDAGGCGEAARVIGLKKAQVGRMYVFPPQARMNVFQKSKLEAFVGRPIVTAVEAAMLGFDLVPVAEANTPQLGLHSTAAAVMAEAIDVARTYAELASDGLCASDAIQLDADFATLAKATERARQSCAAIKAKAIAGGRS